MTDHTSNHSVPNSHSLWTATAEPIVTRPLEESMRADVCIVGAGIAGMSVAYEQAMQGRRVVVLDDGPVGGGMTQMTTAHLASAIDDRFFELERLHGEAGARLAADSHRAAIDRVESIINREGIDCDFARIDGYLYLAEGDDPQIIDLELAAARRAGLTGVERLDRAPMPPACTFDTGPCLRFANQGRFHPLRYLAGLAHAIDRAGGRIFTFSHADAISGGAAAQVTVGDLVVSADAVVVATNSPVNDLLALHTKQAGYMTYVIGARVPRGTVPDALYWDTGHPSRWTSGHAYHYIRVYRSTDGRDDVLIVGGEDHRTGQSRDSTQRSQRLESWARRRFPLMGPVEFAWSGQVMETIDGLAFIGRNPLDRENVYIVTGDSGMGITHGVIAGMLITDLVLRRPNPWAELYEPSRKTPGAIGRFAREAINTASQYADWMTPGEIASMDEIAPDSGAVIRRGVTKLAVYRDAVGALHECSAVCPHLAGIVRWNDAEKTWDCPCHGSRFDKYGEVINGPANRNLARHEQPERVASTPARRM